MILLIQVVITTLGISLVAGTCVHCLSTFIERQYFSRNCESQLNSELDSIANDHCENWKSINLTISLKFLYLSVTFVSALAYITAIDVVEFWEYCLLGWILILLSIIDIRIMIIPSSICIILFLFGIFTAYYIDNNISASLIGSFVGFAILRLFIMLYERIRGTPGMGLGDANLLGAGGAWVGWSEIPDVILIASISGVAFFILMTKVLKLLPVGAAIPFGPMLALGIWIVRLIHRLPAAI